MARADFKKHSNKGKQLAAKNRFSEAILEFEAALAINPTDIDTIFQLGNMSRAMHLFEIAIKWYDVALSLAPKEVEIIFNRALSHQKAGNNNAALQGYLSIADRMPNSAKLYNNLGTLYQQMSMTDKAIKALEKATSLKPRYYEAWNNLGLSYFVARSVPKYSGKWQEAFAVAEKQYKADPAFHVNRATCHFFAGNYDEAWADYAFRHHRKIKQSVVYDHNIPWWQDEDLTGKTILIGEEQGIGDQITFLSALAEISNRADNVILEANPKLVPLLARNFPAITVRASVAETINLKRHHRYDWLKEGAWKGKKIDYFCPMGDAFHYMRPSLEAFPMRRSFFCASPKLSASWKKRLAALGEKPKIGLSWRSSKMTGDRQGAYLELDELGPMIEKLQDKFQFINIQYGDCTEELTAYRQQTDDRGLIHVYDDLDLFDDIEGTFALLDNLDFVLTVRNTQACFAGALGKKVISYHGSFFQFGATHADPVYPSILSLYPHLGYPSAIEQFEKALTNFEGTFREYSAMSSELEALTRTKHFYL